uniref:Uncharacterized protein n=1 Tax=Triticum urartu TaxID=4572 RepID=A0A8R7QI12_TRIUA
MGDGLHCYNYFSYPSLVSWMHISFCLPLEEVFLLPQLGCANMKCWFYYPAKYWILAHFTSAHKERDLYAKRVKGLYAVINSYSRFMFTLVFTHMIGTSEFTYINMFLEQ